jgi:tetratricopeptide (TPR) repeat protein
MGTIAYMSPEQARGEELDARSDIFSLGVVLYEMATGQQAFSGTTAVIFDGILNRVPKSPHSINGSVPPELEGIIARAMEKDREQRFQHAAELGDDLLRLRRLGDAAAAVRDPTPPSGGGGWKFATPPSGVRPRRRRWAAGLAAGLVVAVAVTGWALAVRQFGGAQALGEGDLVLVTDFANSTGDPVFDGTLRQALAVKIEESPFLTVVGEQRVVETLRYMQRPPDTRVTRDIGREICQRQGVKAIIAGDIAPLGESYVVTLVAESCASGDVLAREQVQAKSKEGVLMALGRATAELRGRLGESLASVQKLDKPLEQATTASLEALQAFGLGDRERAKGNELDAARFYRRAVELDPEFAMAYARLGTVYGNVGEQAPSIEYRKRAFALRDRVSERERLYITAHYHASVERDPAKAAEVYELWKRTYPRDSVPHINLGIIYRERGEDDRALASFLEAIRLAPMQRLAYENAAETYIRLGRPDEARALIEREVASVGEHPQASMTLFQLDALRGDEEGMARHAAKVRGSIYEMGILQIRAALAAQAGRMTEFRRIHAENVALLERQGLSERARLLDSTRIVTEAFVGNADQAVTLATKALAQPAPSPEVLVNAGFGLLLGGRVDEGVRTVESGLARMPADADGQRQLDAMAKAAAALRRRRPARALELLDGLEPPKTKDGRAFGVMLLRAEALLAAGRATDAEAQYQKLLAQRALEPFDLAIPLAQLGVAQARARAGDLDGARAAYGVLFETWRDADHDVPVVRDARAARARLGTS